ncbi:hypothetical protein GEMRC1_007510 [Eukaryota sp. GEM-RC1]
MGVDIQNVDHVIQYSIPKSVEDLLQQIGRAGRGEGRITSRAHVFLNPDDVTRSVSLLFDDTYCEEQIFDLITCLIEGNEKFDCKCISDVDSLSLCSDLSMDATNSVLTLMENLNFLEFLGLVCGKIKFQFKDNYYSDLTEIEASVEDPWGRALVKLLDSKKRKSHNNSDFYCDLKDLYLSLKIPIESKNDETEPKNPAKKHEKAAEFEPFKGSLEDFLELIGYLEERKVISIHSRPNSKLFRVNMPTFDDLSDEHSFNVEAEKRRWSKAIASELRSSRDLDIKRFCLLYEYLNSFKYPSIDQFDDSLSRNSNELQSLFNRYFSLEELPTLDQCLSKIDCFSTSATELTHPIKNLINSHKSDLNISDSINATASHLLPPAKGAISFAKILHGRQTRLINPHYYKNNSCSPWGKYFRYRFDQIEATAFNLLTEFVTLSEQKKQEAARQVRITRSKHNEKIQKESQKQCGRFSKSKSKEKSKIPQAKALSQGQKSRGKKNNEELDPNDPLHSPVNNFFKKRRLLII